MSIDISELTEELKKIDTKGIILLLGISLVIGIIYGIYINDIPMAIIAMTFAVFASYFLLRSFTEEEKPVVLLPGEKMIVRTIDQGYMMLPKKKGGFLTSNTERDLNIYLTNKRIFARKASGKYVFEQPLQSITGIVTEKRFFTNYLRITYVDKGADRQVLLFVGDTDLWSKRLAQVGVRSVEQEFDTEGTAQSQAYTEDATVLQSQVEEKKQ